MEILQTSLLEVLASDSTLPFSLLTRLKFSHHNSTDLHSTNAFSSKRNYFPICISSSYVSIMIRCSGVGGKCEPTFLFLLSDCRILRLPSATWRLLFHSHDKNLFFTPCGNPFKLLMIILLQAKGFIKCKPIKTKS